MRFGSGWLSWQHYDALVHSRTSLSRFYRLTGVCSKPQRSQVSVSLVCGECRDDAPWPDMPSNRNRAERNVCRVWILIKFWISCCALDFCLFSGFFPSGVTSWLRYWLVCFNVECLHLIGPKDFRMISGG
jgi:hypothetical protein